MANTSFLQSNKTMELKEINFDHDETFTLETWESLLKYNDNHLPTLVAEAKSKDSEGKEYKHYYDGLSFIEWRYNSNKLVENKKNPANGLDVVDVEYYLVQIDSNKVCWNEYIGSDKHYTKKYVGVPDSDQEWYFQTVVKVFKSSNNKLIRPLIGILAGLNTNKEAKVRWHLCGCRREASTCCISLIKEDYEKGEYKNCLTMLNSITNMVDKFYFMGLCYYQLGKYEKAAEYLWKDVSEESDNIYTYLAILNIYRYKLEKNKSTVNIEQIVKKVEMVVLDGKTSYFYCLQNVHNKNMKCQDDIEELYCYHKVELAVA